MMISVLIAGEDAGKRARLASPLISEGYYIVEAESGERSFDLLKRRQNIALALIDVDMTDISGVDFIGNIRAAGLKMPIIACANSEDDERLRRALASGADDFLVYPVSPARLSVTVGNLLQKHMLRQQEAARPPLFAELGGESEPVSRLAAKSPAMRAALEKAAAAAQTHDILLICGEPGTGRLALARAIHEESRLRAGREEAPFIYCPCHAAGDAEPVLPPPDALREKLRQARGGTLCFGNIDILDKAGQAQFLQFIERALEDRLIAGKRNDGGESCRLMVTACAHLQDLVAEGSFSIGLYKRLSGHMLILPPLRARREDIDDIAHFMLARIIRETGHSKLSGISGAAQALLAQHDWPGNFSELETALFRAARLSAGRLLAARDFPHLAEAGEEQNRGETRGLSAYAGGGAGGAQLFYEASGHIKPLAEIEKEAILEAMKRYRGKISEVARRLKIGRSTLYRKLEEYGLYPERN